MARCCPLSCSARRANIREMSLRLPLVASLLFTSLALVPAGAHLLSLPNKMGMSATDYLVAQQAYVGWNLAGFVVVGALVGTGMFAWSARDDSAVFGLAVSAFLCIAATQAVFWTLNFPPNQATSNWTKLPAHWQSLRQRWELGHALSCLLNLGSLLSLLTANYRLLR
jgi:hypothetical protein